MKRGWHGESNRHRLARLGVKTAIAKKPTPIAPRKKHSLTIVADYVPRGSGNNQYGGKKDLHYKIKEWGYIFPTKEEAEKYANEHIEKNGIIIEKNKKDTDGDGVPDHLDCEPDNPMRQGFFDELKMRVVRTRAYEGIAGETDEVKLRRLRADIEAKEELLEKRKTEKLIKTESKVEKQKVVAELKAKERELDLIQEELEEDTFKGRFKTGLRVIGKKAGILAKKSLKRAGQEAFSDKDPKTYQKVSLTKEEQENTSAKRLKEIRRQKQTLAVKKSKAKFDKLSREEAKLKDIIKTRKANEPKKKESSWSEEQ